MAAPRKKADRELIAHVWVDGACYGPGSDIPADVAKQITNPKAWADADADELATTD